MSAATIVAATGLVAAAACSRAPDTPPPATEHASPPASAASAVRPAASPGPNAAGGAWHITAGGIGSVRAGMPLRDAEAATGGALRLPAGVGPGACAYLAWRGGPPGVRVMVENGRIARVDVDSGAVATEAGARIGDPEVRIHQLYLGRVAVTPQKYTTGHYLTVTPATPADSADRIVFETDGARVTRYRAGRRPPVEYVEGCG